MKHTSETLLEELRSYTSTPELEISDCLKFVYDSLELSDIILHVQDVYKIDEELSISELNPDTTVEDLIEHILKHVS